MNVQRFSDGGFVCHKIANVVHNHHVSAWYNSHGVLLDCEMFDSQRNARAVPHTWTNVYKHLASIGGAYS